MIELRCRGHLVLAQRIVDAFHLAFLVRSVPLLPHFAVDPLDPFELVSAPYLRVAVAFIKQLRMIRISIWCAVQLLCRSNKI